MLVTLNRPKQLNALRTIMHDHLDKLWTWFESEPTLRVAVFIGAGRGFCAGADLREWNDKHKTAEHSKNATEPEEWNINGFGGVSNRRSKKPIIGAINGLCMGGAMEMVINLDIVIATEAAKFALPEVKRGVVAIQGALPRLTRIVGRQRASEMALTGRVYTAQTMADWGIVNKVVKPNEDVVAEAVRWASEVSANSLDSLVVSCEGLISGWDAEDPQLATKRVKEGIYTKMDGAFNMAEGVRSFVEKREPVWRDSKL